ncbi:MAG: hypothetical protein CMF23_02130 [Ignavibacteriae bacterium]|nr:hypothetical protein [Ignavibacteriota bacterium]
MRKINFINTAFIIILTFMVSLNTHITKDELTIPHCEKIELQIEEELLTDFAVNYIPNVIIEKAPQCQIKLSTDKNDKVWKPPISI